MKGISTLKKAITCIIAGLVSSFCFFRIGKRFLVDWMSFPVSRTRLVGTFVLIPVMLNIVLLNACFHIEWGESIQAIELLIALLYLLLCEYRRLAEFFFRTRSDLPSMRPQPALFKALIRFSILFIPFFLIWNYDSPDKNPWLTGKYKVRHLQLNHQKIEVNSCGDSVLSLVYLDQGNDCVFEYNSQQRRLYGIYQLDQTKTTMTVIWHYPRNVHDTLIAAVSTKSKEHKLLISGKMGANSMEMELLKIR
jgi:hypothetical protein